MTEQTLQGAVMGNAMYGIDHPAPPARVPQHK
jgi:hypothetical protein